MLTVLSADNNLVDFVYAVFTYVLKVKLLTCVE